MKKYLLLIILTLQITVAFGQKSGEGATNWSSWQKASPCFPNLYISFKSLGWVPSLKKYEYNFKLKNTSTKHLHFNIDIKFSSGEDYTADGRFDLSPEKELTHVSMYYDTKPIPNMANFFTSLVTKYLENDGRDDWTVPSYSCNGSKPICDANCEKSSGAKGSKDSGTNAGNANNSPGQNISQEDYDTQISNLLKEKEDLCAEFPANNYAAGTSICGKKREDYLTRLVGNENQINNRKKEIIYELDRDIEQIKSALAGMKIKLIEKKAAQEAREKQKVAEKDAFNSNMQKGDEAMGTKNYASAMSHYQTAKSSTTDANDQATAQSKYNQAFEAKKSAELKLQIEFHKRLLSVFQAGRHYYMVFNVYHTELEFISPEIADVLGYTPDEMNAMFFLDRIHPDDKPWFLGYENRSTAFLTQLPLTKRGSYKYQHDYRIKAKDNSYIRLLHQILPIDYDENSYYRSLVMHTDISHIKQEGKPCFSIIGLDGEPSYYNVQDTEIITKSYDLFTRRERETLKSIVEGKSSKEIASELCISIHTVNTHRKNIMNKAGTKTPLDLLRKVVKEGWI